MKHICVHGDGSRMFPSGISILEKSIFRWTLTYTDDGNGPAFITVKSYEKNLCFFVCACGVENRFGIESKRHSFTKTSKNRTETFHKSFKNRF